MARPALKEVPVESVLEAAAPAAFRDRVVGFRKVKASELRKNELNWRLHPESQKSALRGLLSEVGFVSAIVCRETPAGLEIIDGHLRADVTGDAEVPVLVVDLDDAEAKTVLATYDPLSAMALTDDKQLGSLLKEVDLDGHAELRRMLAELTDELVRKAKDAPAEVEFEVPGMALQPHEHYDYLVVLATTTQEWNVLCDTLGLQPAKRRKSMGTCRAIRASQLMKHMKPKAADA